MVRILSPPAFALKRITEVFYINIGGLGISVPGHIDSDDGGPGV